MSVGPGYLNVLGIPLALGRDTMDADTSTSQKVAIVNQTFVQKYLPHTSPLGHEISLDGENDASRKAASVHHRRSGRERQFPQHARETVAGRLCSVHANDGNKQMDFAVRVRMAIPAPCFPDVRRVLRELDPNLPLERPTTQRAQFEESISTERLVANLSLFFGLLAALLVAVGLYGTLSYRISRRTSEIGVRMALGANRKRILWMVVRESLILGAAGLALGLPLAFLLARALRSLLYGLGPADFVTFAVAFLSISIITLLASAIPARRAAGVDPMQALRSE